MGIKIQNISIFSVYRSSRNLETEEMEEILDTNKQVIIAGDLNCKHESWGCPTTKQAGNQLYKFCEDENYHIFAPDEPTRINLRGEDSTLDIFVTKNTLLKEVKTLIELSSDHFLAITTNKIPMKRKEIRYNYKEANWGKFKKEINKNFKMQRQFNNTQELDSKIENVTRIIQKAIENSITKIMTNNPGIYKRINKRAK